MDPAEMEYLAENSLIQIVPRFSGSRISLMGVDVGPFLPNVPTSVPLWLAMTLRQQHKCRVVPPTWLQPERLEELKEGEWSESIFTAMPDPHFLEIAGLLLRHALDDIPDNERVRNLVKDLMDMRQSKLRQSVDEFSHSRATTAKVNNITQMELYSVRNFLTSVMDQAAELTASAEAATGNV